MFKRSTMPKVVLFIFFVSVLCKILMFTLVMAIRPNYECLKWHFCTNDHFWQTLEGPQGGHPSEEVPTLVAVSGICWVGQTCPWLVRTYQPGGLTWPGRCLLSSLSSLSPSCFCDRIAVQWVYCQWLGPHCVLGSINHCNTLLQTTPPSQTLL